MLPVIVLVAEARVIKELSKKLQGMKFLTLFFRLRFKFLNWVPVLTWPLEQPVSFYFTVQGI